jgi:MSHA biogenesis protein MshN
MSLINQVLKDLDERNADPHTELLPDGWQSEALARNLRPVKERGMSELFWWTMALLMSVAVGWVGWVAWQLWPHPVATDLAYEEAAKAQASKTADAAAPSASSSNPAPANPKSPIDAKLMGDVASAAPAPATPRAPSAAPPAPAAAIVAPPLAKPAAASKPASVVAAKPETSAPARAVAPGEVKLDMLRLATELTTPIAKHPTRAKGGSRTSRRNAQQTAQVDPGQIDRRPKNAARERADAQFRRGVQLVNDGRVAEGMDALRQALQLDPSYEAVRQTLVALLVESKRLDDASAVLNDGLALDPGNTGFAMLLARVMVERNDVAGALALLQKHAPANPDAGYHGFAAALHQRLGQHKEAVEQYQAALQLVPSAGIWWLGMGISQQALDRPKEALESYRRARDTGTLGPDLVAFADQRVKLLQ